MSANLLYYGDNLDVLRRHVRDETVDLVYLDPPFNSNQDYNVLFAERDGTRAAAQIKAFGDTWLWDQGSALAYEEMIRNGPEKVALALRAFRSFLGENDMMAYLAMMAPRLIELRRVLKLTGSIFLHCDPTASHYLKLLMDAVFGPENFRNEIVWKRTYAKGLSSRNLPRNHDVILSFQNGTRAVWNSDAMYQEYDHGALSDKTADQYRLTDPDGRRYQLTSLTNPNHNRPNLTYEFLGIKRVWRWTQERMLREYEKGNIVQTKPGTVPRFKRYLDTQRGTPLDDVWIDINPISSRAAERLGYPTQKPEALLERIIRLSSREGDIVLDPFCGCGTSVAAAEKMGRKWIGIDITILAVNLIESRLRPLGVHYERVGLPQTMQEARALALQDRYEFQWWALSVLGARGNEQRRGADRGIDGRLFFNEEPGTGQMKQIIFSVKSGGVGVKDVRELSDVVRREDAEIGVLLTLESSTRPMRSEAVSAGFYHSAAWQKDYPRIQILTVEEMFAGHGVQYPSTAGTNLTFKAPPRPKPKKVAEQPDLGLVTDRDAILAERAVAAEARRELARGVPSSRKRGTGNRVAPAPSTKRTKN